MFKLLPLAILAALAVPSLANAAPCSKFSNQVSKMSDVARTVCEQLNKSPDTNLPCDTVEQLGDSVAEIVAALKKVFPIGPQTFAWGRTQSGTIVSAGKRTWYSLTASNRNSAQVRITKTKRNNKAVRVNICVASKNGKRVSVQQIASHVIDDSKTIPVPNVRGKYLAVEIIGQKVAKNFKYTLKVTK